MTGPNIRESDRLLQIQMSDLGLARRSQIVGAHEVVLGDASVRRAELLRASNIKGTKEHSQLQNASKQINAWNTLYETLKEGNSDDDDYDDDDNDEEKKFTGQSHRLQLRELLQGQKDLAMFAHSRNQAGRGGRATRGGRGGGNVGRNSSRAFRTTGMPPITGPPISGNGYSNDARHAFGVPVGPSPSTVLSQQRGPAASQSLSLGQKQKRVITEEAKAQLEIARSMSRSFTKAEPSRNSKSKSGGKNPTPTPLIPNPTRVPPRAVNFSGQLASPDAFMAQASSFLGMNVRPKFEPIETGKKDQETPKAPVQSSVTKGKAPSIAQSEASTGLPQQHILDVQSPPRSKEKPSLAPSKPQEYQTSDSKSTSTITVRLPTLSPTVGLPPLSSAAKLGKVANSQKSLSPTKVKPPPLLPTISESNTAEPVTTTLDVGKAAGDGDSDVQRVSNADDLLGLEFTAESHAEEGRSNTSSHVSSGSNAPQVAVNPQDMTEAELNEHIDRLQRGRLGLNCLLEWGDRPAIVGMIVQIDHDIRKAEKAKEKFSFLGKRVDLGQSSKTKGRHSQRINESKFNIVMGDGAQASQRLLANDPPKFTFQASRSLGQEPPSSETQKPQPTNIVTDVEVDKKATTLVTKSEPKPQTGSDSVAGSITSMIRRGNQPYWMSLLARRGDLSESRHGTLEALVPQMAKEDTLPYGSLLGSHNLPGRHQPSAMLNWRQFVDKDLVLRLDDWELAPKERSETLSTAPVEEAIASKDVVPPNWERDLISKFHQARIYDGSTVSARTRGQDKQMRLDQGKHTGKVQPQDLSMFRCEGAAALSQEQRESIRTSGVGAMSSTAQVSQGLETASATRGPRLATREAPQFQVVNTSVGGEQDRSPDHVPKVTSKQYTNVSSNDYELKYPQTKPQQGSTPSAVDMQSAEKDSSQLIRDTHTSFSADQGPSMPPSLRPKKVPVSRLGKVKKGVEGWEVRHSNTRNLPYYHNPLSKESSWEPPPGFDSEKLKAYMADHPNASVGSIIGPGSREGNADEAKASAAKSKSQQPITKLPDNAIIRQYSQSTVSQKQRDEVFSATGKASVSTIRTETPSPRLSTGDEKVQSEALVSTKIGISRIAATNTALAQKDTMDLDSPAHNFVSAEPPRMATPGRVSAAVPIKAPHIVEKAPASRKLLGASSRWADPKETKASPHDSFGIGSTQPAAAEIESSQAFRLERDTEWDKQFLGYKRPAHGAHRLPAFLAAAKQTATPNDPGAAARLQYSAKSHKAPLSKASEENVRPGRSSNDRFPHCR